MTSTPSPTPTASPAESQPAPAAPPAVLAPWSGPYGGLPPFDRVVVADFPRAFTAAMREELDEIERIANDPAPPTFDNTILAYERAGRAFDRVDAVWDVHVANLSTPELQAIEREMAPKLAAHEDRIRQNAKLYARIKAVYDARTKSRLTPEQQRLAWLHYTGFALAGAGLDAKAKARLSELNQRLADLHTSFSQQILAEENDRFLVLESMADLAGLPESFADALAAAAEAQGLKGQWLVPNTRSSVEPFLTYSDRRDLREQVWRTFVMRGDDGGANDTNATIAEILRIRAERAQLLGYPTHAHWRLADTMAKTPERAMQLMEAVWRPAVARVREEVAAQQAIADAEAKAAGRAPAPIEPWDYRYYMEKVRKAQYDLDQNDVKPYLQLEKLREGMFWVAGELFGFRFVPVPEGTVPVCHEDVRVWEVKDARGAHVGLWYFDPYARRGKRSGAWMTSYRDQERANGAITPIVSNNSNFVRPRPGEPVLISWDDAITLFHEFGHALHGLASDVTYPALSGTEVPTDYVEFPSQVLERWLATPEVLSRFALHYRTGQPIPAELVRKIVATETFNQGFATVEYLASALVDMQLHLAGGTRIDPREFERKTLADLGMPREIVMRHRTPHFQHVFAGDGYSAGYYSYLWSDTISADAYEAFSEAGGPYDPKVAARLKEHVYSAGNTVDPEVAYRAFRGRDPRIDALMRKRGFAAPSAATTGR
ncbi:MAG: M3 family metallopeptidase [Steroidobacteraceae bacterium]|jgi:peptidyl-dipeptidase Dcp|nr:M3 family metallopeptidase [Steroidobacteraceae bacterium]